MGRKSQHSKHSNVGPRKSSISKPEKPAAQFEVSPLVKCTFIAGTLCAAGLAALGYLSPLHYLSTYNETQIKNVFSNEDNTTWAIVCRSSRSNMPINKDFEQAAKDKIFRNVVKFGVVDCAEDVLPSGKTVKDQFNFEVLQPPQPTIFLVGGSIRNPIVMPSRNVRSHASMVSWMKGMLQPRARSVSSTTELSDRCLDHESCVLILKPGSGFTNSTRQAIQESLLLHRSLQFVTLDGMKYDTTIHSRLKIAQMQVNPEHSFAAIHFRQLSVNKGGKSDSSKAGKNTSNKSWEATAYTADDADNWANGFKGWVARVHEMRQEEENSEVEGYGKTIKLNNRPKVQKRNSRTPRGRERAKKKRETAAERETREELERVQELIRQKLEMAQRKKMDETAEELVTEMEIEDEVNANDQVGGQDGETYEAEGRGVNVEEGWIEEEGRIEDEDEDIVEL